MYHLKPGCGTAKLQSALSPRSISSCTSRPRLHACISNTSGSVHEPSPLHTPAPACSSSADSAVGRLVKEVTQPSTTHEWPARNVVGMSADDVREWLSVDGETAAAVVRAGHSLDWEGGLRRVRGLPPPLRSFLRAHPPSYGAVTAAQPADDGTLKLLCRFGDHQVETVFIPETTRGTVCVSSQVGCSFSCTFCRTGTQRVRRNLTAAEIVSQVMLVRRHLHDFVGSRDRVVTNVVFMGEGEPLMNFRHVTKASQLLRGMGIGVRRQTISTSGVVPNIEALARLPSSPVLAVSLHGASDEVRQALVPQAAQWPLSSLLPSLQRWKQQHRHAIPFAVTLLRGVNDGPDQAALLASLVRPLGFVNLIPFNAWPGAPVEGADEAAIGAFAGRLRGHGARVTVRWSRGRSSQSACGQLLGSAAPLSVA